MAEQFPADLCGQAGDGSTLGKVPSAVRTGERLEWLGPFRSEK